MGSSSSKSNIVSNNNTITPISTNTPLDLTITYSEQNQNRMPLAKIEWIRVFEDGKVGVSVICQRCKRINKHQLHRTTKNSMFVQIDFDKLETRCCPSRGCGEYNLYE